MAQRGGFRAQREVLGKKRDDGAVDGGATSVSRLFFIQPEGIFFSRRGDHRPCCPWLLDGDVVGNRPQTTCAEYSTYQYCTTYIVRSTGYPAWHFILRTKVIINTVRLGNKRIETACDRYSSFTIPARASLSCLGHSQRQPLCPKRKTKALAPLLLEE